MKKFIASLFIIPILLFFSDVSIALADFPNVAVEDSGYCLHFGDGTSGYGEYITAPSPFTDSDWADIGWYISGGSDCPGVLHAQTGSPVPDGTYTFVGASSGSQDFYVIGGLWSLTPPESSASSSATSSALTTSDATFMFNVLISILSLLVIVIFFKK